MGNMGEIQASVEPCAACLMLQKLHERCRATPLRIFISSDNLYVLHPQMVGATLLKSSRACWEQNNLNRSHEVHQGPHFQKHDPIVNLNSCDISVTYKTKCNCTNPKDKKVVFSFWKPTFEITQFPNWHFLGNVYRGGKCLVAVIFLFYFAFPFCSQIEFQC